MDRIGRYQVLQRIGAGGMATAWLAVNDAGERVVLKIPTAFDADAFARLRDEARVGVRLDHPALVQTLDLFEHEGRPVLVLAWIDGLSLEKVVGGQGLQLGAVARVGARVASALSAIHDATDERGRALSVVHRDVSSGNILVDKEGNPRLIDLGIARSAEALHRTKTGTILGTLPYLAPELLDEGDYGPSTDLWALGCVLFECAVGRHLFGGTEAQIVRKLLAAEAWEQEGWDRLPTALQDGLRLLLQRDPITRLADAGAASRMFLSLEATDPGGYRQLGERVHALRGVHLAPPPAAPELHAGTPVGAAPTTTRPYHPGDTVYLVEERLFAVDPGRISTTRRFEAPVAEPSASASGPAPATAPPLEARFAPLAAGQELTEPEPGEFVTVDQLRIAPANAARAAVPPRPLAPVAEGEGAPVIGDVLEDAVAGHDPFRQREALIGRTHVPKNPFQAAGPPDSRSPQAPQARFGPPPAADLELARPDGLRRGGRALSQQGSSNELYPTMARRRGGPPAWAIALVALVVGGGGVYLFAPWQEWLDGKGKPPPRDQAGPVNPFAAQGGLPPDVPLCFTSNDGWFFVYTDHRGTSVVRERIEDVPERFRKKARCVSLDQK